MGCRTGLEHHQKHGQLRKICNEDMLLFPQTNECRCGRDGGDKAEAQHCGWIRTNLIQHPWHSFGKGRKSRTMYHRSPTILLTHCHAVIGV